jgi:hypothetical protein
VSAPNRVAARTPGAVGSTPRDQAGWGLPLVVLIIGMFMSILDTSIVNVAIPTLQNEFGVTTDDVQWVVTAYTLVLGVVVPASAWLGDRFGLNRPYNLALLGFAAGSALCGLAWDLNNLVVFRIIQAIPRRSPAGSCRWSRWQCCTESCRARSSVPRWVCMGSGSWLPQRSGRHWAGIWSSTSTGG